MNIRARFLTWYEAVSTSYWFMPSLMAIGALVLSLIMVHLDEVATDEWLTSMPWLYTGTADGARTLLSVIASSMIGLAGVVFSITIVALTLASGQFGPRLLRNFMQDKGNQITLGTFLAAFLYCLLILRKVHGGSEKEWDVFVPQLSLLAAVVLALAGLGVLIFFIHHAAASIQAPNVIGAVARDLDHAINVLYPETIGRKSDNVPQATVPSLTEREQIAAKFASETAEVKAGVGGYIQRIEADQLMTEADASGLLLRIEHRPGQFVQWDDVVVRVHPASRANDGVLDRIRQTFTVSDQRSLAQDAEFAIEQLVEIAARALSPGINDPFTAMQCVDRLGEALSRLAMREMPSRFRFNDDGQLRVITYGKTFEAFLDASFNQIRQYAAKSLDVLLRMLEAMEHIAKHVKPGDDAECLYEHARMVRDCAIETSNADRDRKKVQSTFAVFEAALKAKSATA